MPSPAKPLSDNKLTPAMQCIDKLCAFIETQTAALAPELEKIEPAILGGKTAGELAYMYKRVRDVREALQAALAPLASEWKASGIYDDLQKRIVPAAFEAEGITSYTSSWGFRVGVSMRYLASMKDKEKAIQWLRDNGLADLVQPTVNASTLSASGKALIDQGKELPDDLFDCYFQATTSMTKVKAKT